jgi:hypothetical protein
MDRRGLPAALLAGDLTPRVGQPPSDYESSHYQAIPAAPRIEEPASVAVGEASEGGSATQAHPPAEVGAAPTRDRSHSQDGPDPQIQAQLSNLTPGGSVRVRGSTSFVPSVRPWVRAELPQARGPFAATPLGPNGLPQASASARELAPPGMVPRDNSVADTKRRATTIAVSRSSGQLGARVNESAGAYHLWPGRNQDDNGIIPRLEGKSGTAMSAPVTPDVSKKMKKEKVRAFRTIRGLFSGGSSRKLASAAAAVKPTSSEASARTVNPSTTTAQQPAEESYAFSVVFGTKRGFCLAVECSCSCYQREPASGDRVLGSSVASSLSITLNGGSAQSGRPAIQRRDTLLVVPAEELRPLPRGVRCATCRHYPAQHKRYGQVHRIEADRDGVSIQGSFIGEQPTPEGLDSATRLALEKRRWFLNPNAGRDGEAFMLGALEVGKRVSIASSSQVFRGKMRGRDVAIKAIRCPSPVTTVAALLRLDEQQEPLLPFLLADQSQDSRSEFVLKFFGIVLDVPKTEVPASLIFEFADRGSLRDVLRDRMAIPARTTPDQPCAWAQFRQLALTAARGLWFVQDFLREHTSSTVTTGHGQVSSRAFFVTSDFRCKLGHVGFLGLRGTGKPDAGQHAVRTSSSVALRNYRGAYEYVAPELFLGGRGGAPAE